MSHISPVAPPPPPPPMLVSRETTAPAKEPPVVVNITTGECSWAWEYPELQKGCYLSRVCENVSPKHCQYYSLNSIVQVGPTCGLVALSMLLGGHPTADELLKDAIALEYTINGEFFSAQYLYELARKHMTGPVVSQLHVGPLDCKKVKELLKAGGCLLVPYPFSKIFSLSKFKPGLGSVISRIKTSCRLTAQLTANSTLLAASVVKFPLVEC